MPKRIAPKRTPEEERLFKRFRSCLGLFAFVTDPLTCRIRVMRVLILTLIFPMVAAVACDLDGTVILYTERSHGLLQHSGYLALFISGPLVIVICLWLLKGCAIVIASPRFTGPLRRSRRLNALQNRLARIVTFRHPASIATLAFASFIGACLLIVNASTTSDPYVLYHGDVWDSGAHVLGFYAAKLFLGYTWMYVYPVSITLAIASVVVICSVVRHVTVHHADGISAYEPDGCAGFRPLGELMIKVVYLDVPFVLVIVGMFYTHGSVYWTLAIGGVILLAGIACQLFLPFFQLHTFLKDAKRARLLSLQADIESLWMANASSEQNGLALLAANSRYERILRISTWPYFAGDSVRLALSFLPVITAVLRVVRVA